MESRQLRAAAAEQHGSNAADGRRRALHHRRFRRPSLRIDGATGETLWKYRFEEGARGDMAPRSVSRGVEYWTDGKQAAHHRDHPRLQMVSLDAKTGLPDPAFGRNGVVDLYRRFRSADAERRDISSTSPAVVVSNVVVVGAALRRHRTAVEGKHQGLHARIRRADRQTSVDLPHHSPAWRVRQRHVVERFVGLHGQHAVWSPFSADEELGYVYLPVESPTGDFYGGHRPGNNLFAGSLVCLDAKTGKRVWHQQLVHHDIWDYDIASPPNADQHHRQRQTDSSRRAGHKQGYLFVFDRVNGTPVWPIEERQVPKRQRAGRVVLADAAASDEAGAVRSPGRARKRI